jgi:hypothetical protein
MFESQWSLIIKYTIFEGILKGDKLNLKRNIL